MRYAAVCNAVAAADLRAKWDLAFVSFVAQSGLILSVVMTVEAVAEIDVVRLFCVCGVSVAGLFAEFIEDVDDMAEGKVARPPGLEYERPLRNGGASYVTPNSDC